MVELRPPERPADGADRKIRLVAPPISEAPAPTKRGRPLRWLTALAFLGVAAVALTVLYVLPAWVGDLPAPVLADRGEVEPVPEPEPVPSSPSVPEPVPGPEPVSEPVPPAPPVPEISVAAEPAVKPPATRGAAAEPANLDPFVEAMSAGLAALGHEGYAAAREAFVRASKLRPGSPQSADGLARAEAGLRFQAIAEIREKAAALESGEDWHAAVEVYEEVLGADPAAGFAQEGLRRARFRADLADRLEHHVGNPERLSSPDVLREVALLLAEAAEVSPKGPRHERTAVELQGLLEAWSRPVRIALSSDNLTDVVVYRVGRLGTFDRRELELRPGTYTVTGSRAGYRDVRLRLVVVPDAAPETLNVRCEEEI